MDLDNFHFTRLINNRRDDKFNLMVKNKVVSSVVMPDIDLTDVTNIHRFIYDLNAPDPNQVAQVNQPLPMIDEMEQGEVDPNQ